MNKKNPFTKRKPLNEDMNLQITSMADIFIILLVFLLKSYTTGTVNLSPSKGLMLPEAEAGEANVEALKIEISENAVSIEGQPVALLKNFKFDAGDIQGNGTSQNLSKVLDRERKRQLLIAQSNADVKVDPKVLIIADQKAPYSTLKAVLASAAINGYTDYKMAVVKGN